jgi:hypothetical protein
MSFKHLGGALTPSQGYVCLRCRFGRSLSARQTIRNIQTESEGASTMLVEAWRNNARLLSAPLKGKETIPGLSAREKQTGLYQSRKSRRADRFKTRFQAHVHKAKNDLALKDAKVCILKRSLFTYSTWLIIPLLGEIAKFRGVCGSPTEIPRDSSQNRA